MESSTSPGNTETQMGGWFQKEIKTVADLKGLKMRIPGIGGEVMGRQGAVPPWSLPGNEICAALERGHRRGRVDRPLRRREARPLQDRQALLLSGVLEGGTETCVMINAAAWDKPPSPIRRQSSPPPPRPMSRCRRSTTPRTRSR
ncbi:MAG: hypothetical protein IPM02_18355 [Betaproteobacteria bacterium]|nr:hypothetical protein [Betaproteobacteria bacterium]